MGPDRSVLIGEAGTGTGRRLKSGEGGGKWSLWLGKGRKTGKQVAVKSGWYGGKGRKKKDPFVTSFLVSQGNAYTSYETHLYRCEGEGGAWAEWSVSLAGNNNEYYYLHR